MVFQKKKGKEKESIIKVCFRSVQIENKKDDRLIR